VKKYPPKRLTSIKSSTTSALKCIVCSDEEDKLFAGTADGSILCFDFGEYGREKRNTKEYSFNLKGVKK